ncbi:MAG: succinate dehydrogenase/fumarate reductase iron-sulfur subunit [Geminicoccaceae bacterium]
MSDQDMNDRDMDVAIWRGGPEGGAFQAFDVPAHHSQTILDVVAWVQQNAEPTLAYRFACRVGMCGSCAMMVNGVPRWTCRTHVKKALNNNRIEIAPLRNLPVIKDLAVDMDAFFDKWIGAEGVFHPTRTRDDDIEAVDPKSPPRLAAADGIECINCAVCYAACDAVATNPGYLGPAALNRAWTLVNDAKDGARRSILDAVSRNGGCQSCHAMGNCAEACPNALSPMNAIAGLKRAAARSFFGREG